MSGVETRGRKPKYTEHARLSLRIEKSLYDDILDRSERESTTSTEIVTAALQAYLNGETPHKRIAELNTRAKAAEGKLARLLKQLTRLMEESNT